jgi:hypothetical protein
MAKLIHILPYGNSATRTTNRPYTHVVCGSWSAETIAARLLAARDSVEHGVYDHMVPGAHYVLKWCLSKAEADKICRASQKYTADVLYVSEITPAL